MIFFFVVKCLFYLQLDFFWYASQLDVETKFLFNKGPNSFEAFAKLVVEFDILCGRIDVEI